MITAEGIKERALPCINELFGCAVLARQVDPEGAATLMERVAELEKALFALGAKEQEQRLREGV